MAIMTDDEILEKTREAYGVKDNIELLQEILKINPNFIQEATSPKLLYQYTTVQALAMILSTKKLKLNSLKNVDDKVEGKSKDIGNLKKYFFASCWTTEERESIPMWNMYGNGMEGIRIGLPRMPFALHNFRRYSYRRTESGK